MKTVWFKNCKTPEEKESVEQSFRGSVALKHLLEILEDELKELDSKETTPDYTSPAWACLQAHRNGYRQHLKQTINLLKDDPP